MKRFIAIVPMLLVLFTENTFAQATCTIDCCNQCFPYYFCAGDSQYLECSNAPHEDGTPAMSWIPSCVEVDAMRPQGIWMPQTGVPDFTETRPTPPDRETIFERYKNAGFENENTTGSPAPPPWDIPYDEGDNAVVWWGDDPTAFEPALDQWNLDSSNFLAGLDWELIDTSGLDGNAQVATVSYGIDGYGWLWEEYDNEETTYDSLLSAFETDSTRHFTGNDVPYSQIWNQPQADTDANDALQGWLNQCTPPVPQTGILDGCCLHIVLDTVATDFRDQLGTFASTVTNLGADGFPTCSETMCPFFARYIKVNTSSAFFYQSEIQREQHPDPSYLLHPVPKWGYYTSETSAPPIFTGFSEFSFYQLAEHEIGHFLGMHHPEQHVGGRECSNCYTKNPLFTTDSDGTHILHPSGFHTVMAQGNNMANTSPLGLTNEDDCQFQKLYCPESSCLSHGGSCLLSGVKESIAPQDWFNPEVFPNPTNGGMTLTFTLNERSLTQVVIYDVLGNAVKGVSSGYSNAGPQSISLGTETLPSGNYVCRVRVGDMVSYINLAITK